MWDLIPCSRCALWQNCLWIYCKFAVHSHCINMLLLLWSCSFLKCKACWDKLFINASQLNFGDTVLKYSYIAKSHSALSYLLIYLLRHGASFSIHWISTKPIKTDQSSPMFFLKPAFKHLSMAIMSNLLLPYANTFYILSNQCVEPSF